MSLEAAGVKYVHIGGLGTAFQLALFVGSEPAALSAAVCARAGLSPDAAFYLTLRLPAETEDVVVVPLTSALPNGMRLELHAGKPGAAANSAEASAAAAAKSATSGAKDDDTSPKAGMTATSSSASATALAVCTPTAREATTRTAILKGDVCHVPSSSLRSTTPPVPRVTWSPPEFPHNRERTRSRQSERPSQPSPLRDSLRSPLLRSPSPGHSSRSSRTSSRVMEAKTCPATPMNQERREPITPWTWKRMLPGSRSFMLRRAYSTSPERLQQPSKLPRHVSTEMEMVTAMERFSRLSTELANERTLLAWVRTCLACVRTGISYVGLASVTQWWLSLVLAQWGMFMLIVLAAVAGSSRYYKIKAILEYKVPPRKFGRISLRPLSVLLLVAAVATASGLAAHAWVKR